MASIVGQRSVHVSDNASVTTALQAAGRATLFHLPTEIRLMIYSFLSQETLFISRSALKELGPTKSMPVSEWKLQWRVDSFSEDNRYWSATWLAHGAKEKGDGECQALRLLWVNRQIRREAMFAVFSNLRIKASGVDCLVYWLTQIHPSKRSAIRHLELDSNGDQALRIENLDLWVECFHLVAALTSLRTLRLDVKMAARCECDHSGYHPDHFKFQWVEQLLKLENMERVDIMVRGYDRREGLRNWADFMHDEWDDGAASVHHYDQDISWVPLEALSRELEREVRSKVLKKSLINDALSAPSNFWRKRYGRVLFKAREKYRRSLEGTPRNVLSVNKLSV